MNVVYDGQIFQLQKAGGINRYFAELITRQPSDWHPAILAASDFGRNRPSHPNLVVSDGPYFRPRRLSYRLQQRKWRALLGRSDVFHPTYFTSAAHLDLKSIPSPIVLTVYDLIFAKYEKLLNEAEPVVAAQREAVRRADRIICISRETERDLLEQMPESIGKTQVIYLASSFTAEVTPAKIDETEIRNFLYVGARSTYKNFSFLLGAFAAACTSCPRAQLHVAGSPFTEDERWQIFRLGLESRITHHLFPDEVALHALYRRSAALLYPSIHEGFGIPPLEAMSCGTIPVTSNGTSLPEIMGDAGYMLDPTDRDAWVDRIAAIARDAIPRDVVIQKGYQQVAKFSWAKTASDHFEVYRSVARS